MKAVFLPLHYQSGNHNHEQSIISIYIDDILFGGNGFNRLTSGTGSDIFTLGAGTGFETITDFNLGSGDRLGLSNSLSFSDLTISGVGRNTVISLGNDELAILRDVSAASMTGSACA